MTRRDFFKFSIVSLISVPLLKLSELMPLSATENVGSLYLDTSIYKTYIWSGSEWELSDE